MPKTSISPRDAVDALLKAYRTFEVARIIEHKDFDPDSRLYWESMGLPVSAERLVKSRKAFESNFRKQMQQGIPDYETVDLKVLTEDHLQDNFAIVTLEGTTSDASKFDLRIPVFRSADGWIVVLHPAYDHL